jgi:hypothetical protein
MHIPASLQQKAGQFLANNASGLLTAGGVVGVGVTAVLTGRASFKAAEIIREKNAMNMYHARVAAEAEEDDLILIPDLTKRQMAMMVWPQYIPPVIVGTATIASIVMANRVSAKRAAALAVAYGISETRLQEYKTKVQEKFGITKERGVRDDIAQERVTNNPPTKEVIVVGNGDVLCFDSISGRYFHGSVEVIKSAENKINAELFQNQYVSLSDFYDLIGLPPTAFSEEVGWNTQSMEPFQISFSTTTTPDNRPCLVLDYSSVPKPDYARLY